MARLATLLFALATILVFAALPALGAPTADTWEQEKKNIDKEVHDWWKAHHDHVKGLADKHHKHHSSASSSASASHTPSLSIHHGPIPTVKPVMPHPSLSKSSSSSASPSPKPVTTPKVSHAQYLAPQNAARAAHGAKPLKWSDSLATKAAAWANKCKFEHSGPGENLAAGTADFNFADSVQLWMNEAHEYNPKKPTPLHFTQVVWKATTEVGCAVAICDGIFPAKYGKAKYFVCEYNTPGNVLGEFPENVQV